MPQGWASSLHDHLDHCRVVFEQMEFGKMRTSGNVRGNVINFLRNTLLSMRVRTIVTAISLSLRVGSGFRPSHMFQRTFPKLKRWCKPSIRRLAPSGMISDSALLWNTADCFLHIQDRGTRVLERKYTGCLLTLSWSPAVHPKMKLSEKAKFAVVNLNSHISDLSVCSLCFDWHN